MIWQRVRKVPQPKRDSSAKKRKSEQGIDGLIHMLEKLHDDTNARLETLSFRMVMVIVCDGPATVNSEQIESLPSVTVAAGFLSRGRAKVLFHPVRPSYRKLLR
ncbi:hypothetical protein AAHA92_21085 [Salvia divinorum]|uniref:Uncharacterized protein n=1 Tax=Salvia divinorum TaxID=28513 RepID=A0ABD1GJB1_SALDI